MHKCIICSNVQEEIIANSCISQAACISQQTGLQVYFPSKALCLFIGSSLLVVTVEAKALLYDFCLFTFTASCI
jgi:hypothetical protein